ncbi:8540_t:CDS:2 [Paraglomus occultum]|uniref:8540_t:CDS:1 n=1 Tax=Paraglomus occultum TaxID=144539 RepID=A0A9N9BVP4_9GLOM|nr:8540_t:CDS:2 [Paraglomus occultum]
MQDQRDNPKDLSELDLLKKRIAELEAENAKLKQIIIIEENTKRDVRVEELERKNTEFEARLAILEQGVTERNREKKLQAQESFPTPQDLNSVTQPCNSTTSEASATNIMESSYYYSDSDKIVSQNKMGIEHKKGKGLDKLKHELFAPETSQEPSIKQDNVTEISETLCPENIDEASQHLAQLCDEAFSAEDRANRANQEEILCWSLYAKDFRVQYNEIIDSSRGKIGERSATSISELTNEQIQEVIDYGISLEKLPHMTEISKTLCPGKGVTKNTPPKAEVSISNESISLDSSQENNQDKSKTQNSVSSKLPDAEEELGIVGYTNQEMAEEADENARAYLRKFEKFHRPLEDVPSVLIQKFIDKGARRAIAPQ